MDQGKINTKSLQNNHVNAQTKKKNQHCFIHMIIIKRHCGRGKDGMDKDMGALRDYREVRETAYENP